MGCEHTSNAKAEIESIRAAAADIGLALDQELRRIATDAKHLIPLHPSNEQRQVQQPADIHDTYMSSVSAAMDLGLHALSQLASDRTTIQLVSPTFWQAAEETLGLGSLQLHARQKPRGYAGDFELFDRICRRDCQGEHLAAWLDAYFLSHAAPQAVRNRTRLVADRISHAVKQRLGQGQCVQVVSLGSGPGWDIRQALRRMSVHERQRVRFVAIDFDPHGLDFVRSWWQAEFPHDLEALSTSQVNLRRLDRWLDRDVNRRLLSLSDYVFCSGFLDYLAEPVALSLMQAVVENTRQGAYCDFFAFGKNNPSRAFMEWVGDWFVIHRTSEQLEKWITDLGLREASVITENAGVNLLLRAQKT